MISSWGVMGMNQDFIWISPVKALEGNQGWNLHSLFFRLDHRRNACRILLRGRGRGKPPQSHQDPLPDRAARRWQRRHLPMLHDCRRAHALSKLIGALPSWESTQAPTKGQSHPRRYYLFSTPRSFVTEYGLVHHGWTAHVILAVLGCWMVAQIVLIKHIVNKARLAVPIF